MLPDPARAQAPGGPDLLQARDVFDMEFAADPQISPDGGGERALTNGDFGDASPRWSPDGKWIAFTTRSHANDFSVACYCEDESHCHRSVLRELLVEGGAKLS